MSASKKSKTIRVAVDAGFSGGKVTVNKLVFNIPFVCIQNDSLKDGDYSLRRVDDNFIQSTYDGVSYTVGEVARTYLLRSKKAENTDGIMQGFYTVSRFTTREFEMTLKTLIAYGLVKYEEYTKSNSKVETFMLEEADQWDIQVGVSLPQSYLTEYRVLIRNYLIGKDGDQPIQLGIVMGTNEEREVSFHVNKNVTCNGQTILAIINELMDEEGNDVDEMFDNLPSVVLDGGYKTMGEALVDVDQSVVGANSNTEYAMMNINERVTEEISRYAAGYHDYMMDELAERGEVIHYLDGEGQVKDISVRELKDRETTAASEKLIEHLLEKFDNLLKVKMILVAGGSGSVFYPFIKEYCDEKRQYLSDKVILACSNPENVFHGIVEEEGRFVEKEITDPVYAVSLGLYKQMVASRE